MTNDTTPAPIGADAMRQAQDEALRLAHALDGGKLIDDSTEWADTLHAAAAELRRLHARAQELERAVEAEREACAGLSDDALNAFMHLAEHGDKRYELTMRNGASAARTISERIRARGAQGESNG